MQVIPAIPSDPLPVAMLIAIAGSGGLPARNPHLGLPSPSLVPGPPSMLSASWCMVIALALTSAVRRVAAFRPVQVPFSRCARPNRWISTPQRQQRMASFVAQAGGSATAEAATASEATAREEPLCRNYVDVHCHIIHEQFEGEEDEVARRASAKGLEYCVVNGLEPVSNRAVLELCDRHSTSLLPALGIYPIDAASNVIKPETWSHPFPPPTPFNIEAEVAFIDQMASEGRIVAVGECGLDWYYVSDPESIAEQERVLRLLIEVAKKHDLPLILHTRKAEARTFEILQEMEVKRADFHCYCGKVNLAKKIAAAGYYFSIPSAVARVDSFQKLAKELPLDKILTETDSPYQGPEKGVRNEPATVPLGVAAIAKVKGLSEEDAAAAIRQNFQTLFKR